MDVNMQSLSNHKHRLCSGYAIAVVVLSLLMGCSSMRYGGAPEPSFDLDRDLEQLAEQFKPADSIKEFYKNPTKDSRDDFITGRITMMNIRYIQFIRQVTADRQLLDSAADMLTLGLSIGGASFGTAATKTILAAVAAGIGGSKQIVDKNYYFDKTLPALVGQMNAERKNALIPILQGMKNELTEYPFGQAVTDLYNYYHAGTFAGAIQAIQADAATKEQEKDREIRKITPLAPETRKIKRALTLAVGTLKQADLEKIKTVVRGTPGVTPANDFSSALNQLQDIIRNAKPEDIPNIKDRFEEAGIPVAQ